MQYFSYTPAPPKVVDALSDLLESELENERATAARILGNIKSEQATSALLRRLKDDDIDVCIDTLEALGKIADPSTVGELTSCLLNDPDSEVKLAAAQALASMGTDEALQTLMQYALQTNDHVQAEDAGDWDIFWDIQLAAVQAMGQKQVEAAVPILQQILNDEDGQDIESEVINSMARCGTEGTKAVIARLQSDNARERRRAAKALCHSQYDVVESSLTDTLSDPSVEVRIEALQSLISLAPHAHLNTLIKLAHDEQPAMRECALSLVDQLAHQGKAQSFSLPQLLVLLGDDNATLRALLINILTRQMKNHFHETGTLPDISAAQLEQLRNLLASRYTIEAVAACELAEQLRDPDAEPALNTILLNEDAPTQLRRQAGLALAQQPRYHQQTLDNLSACLQDPQQAVRLVALQTLMALHTNGAQRVETTDTDVAVNNEHETALEEAAPTRNNPTPLQMLTGLIVEPNLPEHEADIELPMPEAPAQAALKKDVAQPEGGNSERIDLVNLEASTTSKAAPPLIPENYSQDYSNPNQNKRPTSTLDAITQENVEAALLLSENHIDDSTLNIKNLLSELPEEDEEYRRYIENNLTTADKLFVLKQDENSESDLLVLCVRVLAATDDEDVLNILIQLLSHEDPLVRQESVQSLGKIAQRGNCKRALLNASGSLLTQLQFGSDEMRLAIVRTCGLMQLKSAAQILISYVNDESTEVRKEAIQALLNISHVRLKKVAALAPDAVDPKYALEEEILGVITEALQDTEYSVRKIAASTLAQLQYAPAEGPLIATGVADGGQLSISIGQALRELNLESTATRLVNELKSTDRIEDNCSYRSHIASMLQEMYRIEHAANHLAA